jgi:hypothetical protein
VASRSGAFLADIVHGEVPENVRLGPFRALRKVRFFVDLEKSYEIDIHAVSADDDGTDLMVEVKDLKRTAAMDAVRRFIKAKEIRIPQLERKTVFLFYSESGVNANVAAALAAAGILIIDPEKLATFEATGRSG